MYECFIFLISCKVSTEKLKKSLLLAICVCYVAKLEARQQYIAFIRGFFTDGFELGEVDEVQDEIERYFVLAFVFGVVASNISFIHSLIC